MVYINDEQGLLVAHGKDLRVLCRHARRQGVAVAMAIVTKPPGQHKYGGKLHVVFGNGDRAVAEFHDWELLCHWLRQRQDWRGCRLILGESYEKF